MMLVEGMILIITGIAMLKNIFAVSGMFIVPLGVISIVSHLVDSSKTPHWLVGFIIAYGIVFKLDGTKRWYIIKYFS